MSLVRKVIKVALRGVRTRQTRRELRRLGADQSDEHKWLWAALLATLEGELTAEEREWVQRIEGLRRTLSTSETVVSRVDYGARDPHMQLSDEAMYRGETRTATIGHICRTASNPPRTALLLFKLIRAFRPRLCLELGTSLGISAAYQAAALALNGAGRLVTLEGAETIAAIAREHLLGLGLTNVTVMVGRFQDTLEGVLREQPPIDYAFVDGHHDEHATGRYFRQIVPSLAPKAVVVFDDIEWNAGMQRAWKTIAADASVVRSINLAAMGVCVLDRSVARRAEIRWPVL